MRRWAVPHRGEHGCAHADAAVTHVREDVDILHAGQFTDPLVKLYIGEEATREANVRRHESITHEVPHESQIRTPRRSKATRSQEPAQR